MRRPMVIPTTVAVPTAAARAGAVPGTADDEEALDAHLVARDAAFDRHDARAVAALDAEDAECVLPDGRRLQGRAAIEEDLAGGFAANPDIRTTNRVTSRRSLKPDVVIEDGEWEDAGHAVEGDPTGGLFTTVPVKRGGSWRSVGDRVMVPVGESPAFAALTRLGGDAPSKAVGMGEECRWKRRPYGSGVGPPP